jgi:hypothetical protein
LLNKLSLAREIFVCVSQLRHLHSLSTFTSLKGLFEDKRQGTCKPVAHSVPCGAAGGRGFAAAGVGDGSDEDATPSNSGTVLSGAGSDVPQLQIVVPTAGEEADDTPEALGSFDAVMSQWEQLMDRGDYEGVLDLLEREVGAAMPDVPPVEDMLAAIEEEKVKEKDARRTRELQLQEQIALQRVRVVDRLGRSYATGEPCCARRASRGCVVVLEVELSLAPRREGGTLVGFGRFGALDAGGADGVCGRRWRRQEEGQHSEGVGQQGQRQHPGQQEAAGRVLPDH